MSSLRQHSRDAGKANFTGDGHGGESKASACAPESRARSRRQDPKPIKQQESGLAAGTLEAVAGYRTEPGCSSDLLGFRGLQDRRQICALTSCRACGMGTVSGLLPCLESVAYLILSS